MSAVELHNVDDAVDEIIREIPKAPRSAPTWCVFGEATAGKSALLELLHEQLADGKTVRSVLVTPPPRAYDAGHAALIDLAEGLQLSDRAMEVVRDPKASWSSKLKRVRTGIVRSGRIVLLVDEPDTWSPGDTYFQNFVRDIWSLLFDGFDSITVTAGRPPYRVRQVRPIYLQAASDPEGVLAGIQAPELAVPKSVVHARFHEDLAQISPLQIRLLVAIAALDERALGSVDLTVLDHRHELVGALAGLVDDLDPELRDVWLRLATVREPFDDELLGLAGGRDLGQQSSAIVNDCLLFRRRNRLVLHESLRSVTNLLEHDAPSTHGLIAAYYRHRFTDPVSDAPVRLRDSVEAFHHASSAGIFELDTYRPFFVDQLNILGYQLSVHQGDLERAAEAFGVALQWDAKNAYAAHYRAFNLDRLAGTPGASVEPNEVEALYRQALEQEPTHPWFRSRLITFLIAEARIDEAWSEWLRASEAIGPDPSDQVYFGLHLHVARSLLYRGELEHVTSVLKALPLDMRNDERFASIAQRLAALREARDRGSYVPAPFMRPGWWKRPNLLTDHDNLGRWLAARVCDVSPGVVELDVADITPGLEPALGSLELPVDVLARWWRGPGELATLECGEFLEVGFYGDDETSPIIALRHPRVRWPDFARPHEDPDRYLRIAA